ncbi:MAG: glutamate-1-semialdehyde aminotransferase [Rhodobacteraceae bacterium]|nr:glutamate-1-semialdehyde aminotransferase [Paracoccaceae bacterium]
MEKNQSIVAIVQARMNSTRLPGKVLKMLGEMPALELLLRRLKKSKCIDKIIVATSTDSKDNGLKEVVANLGFDCFRGSENNVLERYVEAMKSTTAETIVRITGDCPLIDPTIVDKVIEKYAKENVKYASNVNPPSFPDGMDVEVIDRGTMESLIAISLEKRDLEHVTSAIHRDTKLAKTNLSNPIDLSKIRLTLDENEDLEVIRSIVNHFSPRIDFTLEEIIDLYNQDSSMFDRNKHLNRNQGSIMNTGQKLWKKAKSLIPGGNMLLSKRTEMFHPNDWPAYFEKAKGCTVWDLDGKKFTDMSLMGVGTNILGYANNEVDKAVKKNINKSNMSTLNCPEEVFLAEKLISMHSWSQMARFARTGGEANSIAIRIGRAASGKDGVAICGYHGWHDWYLASNMSEHDSLKEHLLPGLEVSGVPKALKNTTFPFRYNDIKGLKKIINDHDIGVIKMEVTRNIKPDVSFLKSVRTIAKEHGIILIFDECTSGFRESFGGIHLKYGINPDLAIFGKALGNGYAITAVLGTRIVMEEAQKSFISSTFWTERVGATAALKTLEIMERDNTWETITEIGKKIQVLWKDISNTHGLDIEISGIPSLSTFKFYSKNNLKYKTLITQEMLKKNFLASNAVYTTVAHKKTVINRYFNELDKIFQIISACENQRIDIDKLIHGPVCHSGFQRLN